MAIGINISSIYRRRRVVETPIFLLYNKLLKIEGDLVASFRANNTTFSGPSVASLSE